MQYQRVEVGPGYELLLPFDGESFYCPMCAVNCGNYPPFCENSMPAYDWICSCCRFFPGNEGGPREGSGLTQEQYLAAYRKRWLDEHDWIEAYVNQLRDVFQLNEQDIEAIRNASELS